MKKDYIQETKYIQKTKHGDKAAKTEKNCCYNGQ